jgi:hypothetical protein
MNLLLDECIPGKSNFSSRQRVIGVTLSARRGSAARKTGASRPDRRPVRRTHHDRQEHSLPAEHDGEKTLLLIIRPASNDIDDRPHIPAALAALESMGSGEVVVVGG